MISLVCIFCTLERVYILSPTHFFIPSLHGYNFLKDGLLFHRLVKENEVTLRSSPKKQVDYPTSLFVLCVPDVATRSCDLLRSGRIFE